MDRFQELLEELKDELEKNAVDKSITLPKSENLAAGKDDKHFDIDLVFIRRPGMRRSIQYIASGTKKPEYIKMSCCAAICSLLDTMISQKDLHVGKEDVVRAFVFWMESHGIRIVNVGNPDKKPKYGNNFKSTKL